MEKVIQALLSELQKISRAETVIGEPIKSGETTILPISRVQIGFGAGGSGDLNGDGDGQKPSRFSGSAIGGGIRVEPVACVIVNPNGSAQLLQLSADATTTVAKVIDLVPDVLDRLGVQKGAKATKAEKTEKR